MGSREGRQLGMGRTGVSGKRRERCIGTATGKCAVVVSTDRRARQARQARQGGKSLGEERG